jgi:ABC-2 type transport system ATP-binding protein
MWKKILEPIIQLDGVSKWYGEVIGLNQVTTSIGPGITALLGHNGAGKTTFLSLVTGQIRPSQGRVTVFGQNPWNNPAVLNRIGYCPEADTFWSKLTGRQFLWLLARVSGFGRAEAKRRVVTALERVRMTDDMDRDVGEYSRGMRQRIKIAQALLHDPPLLILDEPLSGMDPVIRSQMNHLFSELAGQGRTIVISSHVLYEIQNLTDSVLVMDRSRLAAEGDLGQALGLVQEHPRRVMVRTSQPRKLAQALLVKPYVAGVALEKEDRLFIDTFEPDRLSHDLPQLIADAGVRCYEIASSGDDLEAVFSYLTGGQH